MGSSHHHTVEGIRKQIDDEIDCLCAAIQTLRARRNGLAPIHKLPNEIFGTIFNAVLLETRDSCNLLPLSQVCVKWRQISIAFSMLWTRINVATYATKGNMASELFGRSKSAPLKLFIDLVKCGPLECDLFAKSAGRIQEMSVRFDGQHLQLLQGVLDTPQPLLQMASLTSTGAICRFPQLFTQSHNLRELRLDNVASDLITSYKEYPNLVHLDIRNHPGPNFDPFPLLAHLLSLEIFIFDFGVHRFPDAATVPGEGNMTVKLPSLRKFGLIGFMTTCVHVINRIDLSPSAYITLDTSNYEFSPNAVDLMKSIGRQIRQPSRELLMLHDLDSIKFVGSSFEWVSADILESGGLLISALQMLADSAKFEHLEIGFEMTLEIEWLELLPTLSNLVCLDVKGGPPGSDLFHALREAELDDEAPVLPKLQAFIIRIPNEVDFPYEGDDDSDIDETTTRLTSLVRWLRVRKAAGRLIPSLKILLEDDSDDLDEDEVDSLEGLATYEVDRIDDSCEYAMARQVEVNPNITWFS